MCGQDFVDRFPKLRFKSALDLSQPSYLFGSVLVQSHTLKKALEDSKAPEDASKLSTLQEMLESSAGGETARLDALVSIPDRNMLHSVRLQAPRRSLSHWRHIPGSPSLVPGAQ
jgi:hypothetical protein